MSTEKTKGVQTWPGDELVLDACNPGFHNGFKALMAEEDRIVQPRELENRSHAYFTGRGSAEFNAWVLGATESLEAQWRLLATKAGMALRAPRGTLLPSTHWLHQLVLDLPANESDFAHLYSDTAGIIERVVEASAIYAARLEYRSLEAGFAQSAFNEPSIAVQLAGLRDECRLTVEELAELVNLDPTNVTRHLSGRSIPQIHKLVVYEHVFSKILKRPIVLSAIRPKRRVNAGKRAGLAGLNSTK